MDRKEIAYKEATRDPIFLFQLRRVILNAEYDTYVEWDEELEVYITTGKDKKYLDDYGLVAHGFANITWDTIGVFLTREEAEAFGEQTSYRYGSKGKNVDWRVYCIALERDSELCKIINNIDSEDGMKVDEV